MGKQSFLQKVYDCFFEDNPKIQLTDKEQQQLVRYRHAFHFLMETPWISNNKLRDELMIKYNITESQAYRDITTLEYLKGKVQNTTREFQQFKVNEALNRALELAIADKDPSAIAKVATAIGKFNRLDRDPVQEIPFDQIIPQPIELTNNPEILGIKLSEKVKENPQEYIDKMILKYNKQIELENYVDYEEVE